MANHSSIVEFAYILKSISYMLIFEIFNTFTHFSLVWKCNIIREILHFIKRIENIVKDHFITVSLYELQYVHTNQHGGAREVRERNWPIHCHFWSFRYPTTFLIFFVFCKTANKIHKVDFSPQKSAKN